MMKTQRLLAYSRLRFLLALFWGAIVCKYVVFCCDRFSDLEAYAQRFSGKSWGPDMAAMGVILLWMCSILWVSLRYASWTRARVKLELLMGIPLLLLMGMIGFALLMFWITGDFPIDK